MGNNTEFSQERENFREGLKGGVPIALGYFPVAFTLGILGVQYGLTWWQVTLISALNLTSAGQFAALDIIRASGSLIEMALSQFTINLRYSLMSITLSQKTDESVKGAWRFIMPFSNTDEIFALAVTRGKAVTPLYWTGLSLLPFFGWTLGTAAGSLLGQVLPEVILSAMGIAIYGMFLAIIVPPSRRSKPILFTVVTAGLMSVAFYYLPGLNKISGGFRTIICGLLAAALAAWRFPVRIEEEEEGEAATLEEADTAAEGRP